MVAVAGPAGPWPPGGDGDRFRQLGGRDDHRRRQAGRTRTVFRRADAAHLLYVPWVLVALLLFPRRRESAQPGPNDLDGVVVASSFFLISWVAEMRDVFRSGTERGLDFAVAVAYPLGDIPVVTVAFLVLVRAAQLRVMWSLLLGGLVPHWRIARGPTRWTPRAARSVRCPTSCTPSMRC